MSKSKLKPRQLLSIVLIAIIALAIVSGTGVVRGQTSSYISLSYPTYSPTYVTTATQVTVPVTFTDPSAVPWAQGRPDYVTLGWDDGSVSTSQVYPTAGVQFTIDESHTYSAVGHYYPGLQVENGVSGGQAFFSFSVTVHSAATTLSTPTFSPAYVTTSTPVTANATFTENGGGTPHSVQWDWGDGTQTTTGAVTEPTDTTPGTVNGTHNFAAFGTYTVTCTVTDSIGDSASQTASVTVNAVGTQLSATASQTTVTNEPFWVNGTLNVTGGNPIAGAAVQLQKNVSGSWTNVTGAISITNSNGAYRVNASEPAKGTYQYRATYAGNGTYANATSNVVNVSVNTTTTQLSAASKPETVAITKSFAIAGTLYATGDPPVANAAIQLQKNVSGSWTNVTGAISITNSNGAYRVNASEPAKGTYQYRATYAGNGTYANATSNVVSVKVVSKASVLADLNALTLTVASIPSSAFAPGMKITTLTVITATEVNVRVGSYAGAATELKSALLPRMDGCAKTGKPDSDDWVRTCAAQGQLYPQVQNLIQELQALQGS